MFPKLKKKILSFLMDEKGTMSKDKLLKGALFLSTVGLAVKSSKAFQYDPDYLPDDYLGWDDSGGEYVPCNPVESLCKIGGVVESSSDGGRIVVAGAGQPDQPFCGGVTCQYLEENEILQAHCVNIPDKKCPNEPACFWPATGAFPIHSSSAETVHKSVDRTWHTNRVDIYPKPGVRAVEAKHSHHGRHHNANTVNCQQQHGTPFTVGHTSNCYEEQP